jgi:rubrerythrin
MTREEALDRVEGYLTSYLDMEDYEEVEEIVKALKQDQKTGHWILVDVEGGKVWHCKCSKCGKDPQDYVWGSENWWLIKSRLPKFCPNCGARMEVEE